MRTTLALAASALAASAAVRGFNATASGCTGTSFDFFVLVTQWDITECMDNYSCTSSNQFFTLHGLWPTNDDGSYPCTCTSEQFDPTAVSSIMDELNTYWLSLNGPNTDFWSHEWSKHGTCADFNSQLDFFTSALNLRAKYDVAAALTASGHAPSNTKGFTLNQFHNATNVAFGHPSIVQCDSNGNVLQVDTCFDQSLNLIACPSSVDDDCSASTLYLPSSQQ